MAEAMAAQETWWHVALIEIDGRDTVILHVEPTRSAIACPTCGSVSSRRHSSYRRRPLDLPWRGATVRLVVYARRFFCDVPTCPRKIFAERFDGLLACCFRFKEDPRFRLKKDPGQWQRKWWSVAGPQVKGIGQCSG